MKKSVLIILSLVLVLGLASCKKEVIEIVNNPDEVVVFETRDGTDDQFGQDNVTDPDDEEDFERESREPIDGD